MFDFLTQSTPPPTTFAKKLVNYLKVIMVLQLLFGIATIFIGPAGLTIGNLVSSFIIFQGYRSLSACQMSICLYVNCLNLVFSMTTIALVIQSLITFGNYNETDLDTMSVVLHSINLVISAVAIIICFLAYREFKAILYDNTNPAISSENQMLGASRNIDLPNYPQQTSNRNNGTPIRAEPQTSSSGFGAFKGKGVSLA